MRWSVAIGALLACTSACEMLVGITDKTVTPDGGGADRVDAAGDMAADGGALDPSAPCAQQPQPLVFCDDFDSVGSVSETWDWQAITPAQSGSMSLDDAQFTSPPRSAQLVVRPVMGQVQLGVTRDLAGATKVHVAFDLRLEVDTLSGVPQVALVQAFTRSGIALNYVVGPGAVGELEVYDQSVTPGSLIDSIPLATLPPVRSWTRIVLVYDAAVGAVVYQDGTETAQSRRAARSGSLGVSGFIFGAAYVNPPGSTALTSEFDNVVVRVP